MRVALVHDWLTGMRGGERCLEELCQIFPQADIYTLLYTEQNISATIREHRPRTGLLQRVPGVRRYYRYLLPLFPLAIRNLSKQLKAQAPLDGYDLVISVSHCVAKNIRLPKSTFHLCYCLTPMRYLWDQYDAYFAGKRIEPLVRMFRGPLQGWDTAAAEHVDQFVGISEFIKARIQTIYERDAEVVYPPVRADWITPAETGELGHGFLVVNALVPYKNTEVIIHAFNKIGEPLTIVGDGPQRKYLESIACANISFLQNISDEKLARLYRGARGMIFAAEEDFGMTPVEMQAAGRPVIAYGRGGALETVVDSGENPTGIFFYDLSAEGIAAAVHNFLDRENSFTVNSCLENAEKFSLQRFRLELKELLASHGFEIDLEKFNLEPSDSQLAVNLTR